jgi:hypothetical protein
MNGGDAEVIVVGGGPAGAALALRLAEDGRDVLVLERSRFPRDKPCGDCLNPGAVAELRHLRLADALRDALRPAPLRALLRRRDRPGRSLAGAPPWLSTASCSGGMFASLPISTANCPFSNLVIATRPRWLASSKNLLNRLKPASFSSKLGSMDCITCFKRSERITSSSCFMRMTASTTNSHGSRLVYSVSPSRVRPVSSV